MKASKGQTLRSMNTLFAAYELPTLNRANEASPNLIIALYESLKGVRLKLHDRKSRSTMNKIRHTKILLRTISRDVMRMDVSSLCPVKITHGDEEELLRLFEVIIAISRILHIAHGHRMSYSSDMTATTFVADINCSKEYLSSCGHVEVPDHTLLDSKSVLDCSTSNQASNHGACDRSFIFHRADRKTTLINECSVMTDQKEGAKRDHDCTSNSPCVSTIKTCNKVCPRSYTRSRQPKNFSGTPTLPFHRSASGKSRVSLDPLSFFSEDQSILKGKPHVIVDSPYSKYVQARHTIALYEIRNRGVPSGSSYPGMLRSINQRPQEVCLARSIGSLADSDASFYDQNI